MHRARRVAVSEDEPVQIPPASPITTPIAPTLRERVAALAPAAKLVDAAARAGIAAYLVGGTVRDLLLDREPLDIDVAVDGEPDRLVALLDAVELNAEAPTPTRFQTLALELCGARVDIARTRSERYPHPGALPEVAPAGIEVDLWRRDFSVNAIAVGLSGPYTGALLALPGALENLAAGRLAVLHDQSFIDDPTRLLRLARYAARLRFKPEAHTRALASEAIAAGALKTLSGPRLGNELRLLAAEQEPLAAFAAAAELGLPWTLDRSRAARALELLPADGRGGLLVLAASFSQQPYSADARSLKATLDHLGFSANERELIVQAAGRAPALAARLAAAHSGAEIAAAVGGAPVEAVALAATLAGETQARSWLADLRHRALAISGDDLIAHGIPEGPAVGAGLAAARTGLFDGLADSGAAQLELALRAASAQRQR